MANRMDWKTLSTVFASVFIAELGDKTQLATMLFATDKEISKLTVFAGASLALILTSALGVIAGDFLANYINEKYLHYLAGLGFITVGLWVLLES
jgi:putative Ca2+/H+ antiporter (TMEM165/GDT1 family)